MDDRNESFGDQCSRVTESTSESNKQPESRSQSETENKCKLIIDDFFTKVELEGAQRAAIKRKVF